MTTSTPQYVLPTREQRDELLNVVYAGDQQPARCTEHRDAVVTARQCTACNTFHRWRQRMYRRFHNHGLRYVDEPTAYDDPEPPRCPVKHPYNPANRSTCPHCRAHRNWKQREYVRAQQQGVGTSFTDWDTLMSHMQRLRAGGLGDDQIARRARCGRSTVQRLFRGPSRIRPRSYVRNEVAQRLLAIPVPDRTFALIPDAVGAIRRRVDATGTHRRMQGACRAGHNLAYQVRRLGYSKAAAYDWMSRRTVPIEVAEAVARLFPTLIARPGTDTKAVGFAISKGWPPARLYCAANIDDPGYDPYAFLTEPVGVYRRLRALARNGQGPDRVAVCIGEPVENVELWLKGGPVPAYAQHLVAAAYTLLSQAPGPDDTIAARARRQAWLRPGAWRGADIDDPGYDPYAPVAACHGARRRLRAMAWMGHGPRQVAGHLEERVGRVRAWMLGDERIPGYALPLIAGLYELLTGDFGPDRASAALARRYRWAPPLAWEYIDMDDVQSRPHHGMPPGEKKSDHPLDSQVYLALLGLVSQEELLHAERVKAVRELHRAGWSDRRIAVWLRWNADGDSGKGLSAVCAFRFREGITGYGLPASHPTRGSAVAPPAA